MKALSFISIGAAITFFSSTVTAQLQTEDSPFHWPGSQNVISPFATSGKMETKGRTGVAAMHATLLK
jgi:hypothetical protein